MSAAVASLVALLLAVVLSMTTRVNVGLVAMALAWLVGRYVAGLDVDTLVRGFPSSLFLTLFGVTLLFAAAETNGTLERLAQRAVRLARGSAARVPVVVFFVACAISAVGPGAISTVALVAPLAMAIGAQTGVGTFLMSLVVANGANAGNLSPISAVGVIANNRMAAAGIGPFPIKVMLANFLASAIVAAAAYVLLRPRAAQPSTGTGLVASLPFAGRHWLTLAVVMSWIAGVLFLELPLGFTAIAAAVMLILTTAADETAALGRVPWGVIVMVSGVTTLIAVVERTGGMDLFVSGLASLASPATVNGVVAFVTGAISLYSSTSGVVLPAFLPTVPGLVERLGGGDPLAIALSVNVGSSLVDVSPLSTLGALCLAAAADPAGAPALFRRLMLWGVAMTVVGAVMCQLFAGVIARW